MSRFGISPTSIERADPAPDGRPSTLTYDAHHVRGLQNLWVLWFCGRDTT